MGLAEITLRSERLESSSVTVARTAPPHASSRRSLRHATRGQALIVLVLMLSIASTLLVYGSTTELGRAVKSEARTQASLAYAREALIGRAVADANRPGSLPCPDTDDDGSAELFVGSACPSYIGRLPWRTLSIGDLRDDAGERLWYALSPAFRDHPSAPALNSDTRGTLTLYSISEATALTREAVAIVFAPGAAVGAQARDTSTAQCSTTGRHVPRDRCSANYLEGTAGFTNASAAGPYITAPVAETFNDRVAVIVTADLMPLVEQRVAMEARSALLAYKAASACACYPWAAGGLDGASEHGQNRGFIPSIGVLPDAWPQGVLPAYFRANRWGRIIRYAVARAALEDGGRACDTCRDTDLSIDETRAFELVLITPGYAERPRQNTADYVDDVENRDDDDRYVTPRSQTAARDRIYAISNSTR